MAVKKKVKISNVKRSQHMKNKKNFTKPLKKKEAAAAKSADKKKPGTTKAGGSLASNKVFGKPAVDKTKRRDKRNQVGKLLPLPPPPSSTKSQSKKQTPDNGATEADEDSEDDYNVQDMIDMIDDDDRDDYRAAADGSQAAGKPKKRKRPAADGDDVDVDRSAQHFERQYAALTNEESQNKKRMVNLLPIKTKGGEVVTRQHEVDEAEEEDDDGPQPEDELGEDGEGGDEEAADSDDDIIRDEAYSAATPDPTKMAISTADLLILREQEIAKQKYRIGIICSGILEKPEDKMKNFGALFELMDERHGERINLVSVRKIACVSLLEVFRDVLPEYRIGQINLKMQTVRKNTMERISFENTLLAQYKKYLQKLEKMSSLLTRRTSREFAKLGECAVMCMCELLIAHPYFNFGQNICQLLVYLVNCNVPTVRTRILACFQEIFRTDKKFDLTLFIVRRLNHLIKSKSNCVHVEILTCLLALQIKSINLDAEKEGELKQKKLEAHKARLMNMSKKEKKRHKKLSQLDKELQETKAEENKQTKHHKLTEITKMVFTIYFRILKNDPNSQLLSATLEGLAEFSHIINLDFFSDLVEVLNTIMETVELGHREQLHCISTVFTILSGQGEVLNIDPLRFYGHLYRNLFVVHAGQSHPDLLVILRTLYAILIRRRKHMSHGRMLAFVKRVSTLSLQLLHHGTAACLGVVKTVMQLQSTLEILLDTDTSVGSGRYDAQLDDPEYCNAQCTALYEMATLGRHYHPVVRRMAHHIAAGVPATGEGSLVPEIGKLSHMELYNNYDSTEMSFNPPIPPPKPKLESKEIKGRHCWQDRSVEERCEEALRTQLQGTPGLFLDFAADYRHGRKHQQEAVKLERGVANGNGNGKLTTGPPAKRRK